MANQLPQKILKEEIQTHINTREMRQQLINQLLKDLSLEEIPVQVESESFFSELQTELTFTMRYFIESQPQQIPNLIYRIDLNERDVRTTLQNPEVDAAQAFAEMIVLREMKKVFYRNVYSGKIVL